MKIQTGLTGQLSQRARLEEEIHYMEVRLNEIGFEGDCAYERAMSKFYREQIATRRAQLDRLDA